ncbi:hypothetical protein [uncultured Maribacter sp.]|uniref:hypothetical protein n=1 Tax=uncultured Maribacter sp. TaxID=431308 RepID=UPI0030D85D17
MEDNENTDFDFVKAINRPDTYGLLFPGKLEGTVIIALYERLKTGKYQNGFFNEEEIHAMFSTFKNTSIKGEKYYPKERNKQRIRKLLKYFLNYDEEKRLYSFQDYGLSFCKIAKKTLKGTFDPTEIEIICNNLKRDLEEAFGSDEQLLNWFRVNLDVYKTRLAQQTEFLHRQIDFAVEKLRKDVLNKQIDPLDLLRTVRDDLTDIQKKNGELRIAFEDTNKISNTLIKIETDNGQIIDFIEDTSHFFSSVQSKLRSTDRRLDRIQPKIKQLFATLRRPELSANTDAFIHFLLKHSKVKRKGNDKVVELPREVKPFLPHLKRPKLLVFKRNTSLFPTASKKRKRYPVNEELQRKNKTILQETIKGLRRIDGWVIQLLAQLDKDGHLDVSQSFFNVLEADKDFETAAHVMYGVIEKAYQKKKYRVTVLSADTVTVENSKNRLWKTMIEKK